MFWFATIMLGAHGWYKAHPYGVYPRGNARCVEDITDRFGTFSCVVRFKSYQQEDEHAEASYLDVIQNVLSFLEVPDLCELSRACTGWYIMVHCTDAFKNAYHTLSPSYMNFHGSWKESAVRAYLQKQKEGEGEGEPASKRSRREGGEHLTAVSSSTHNLHHGKDAAQHSPLMKHTPLTVSRAYYCDQLFQAWMCTILPPDHYLRPIRDSGATTPNADPGAPQYLSRFKPVDRRSGLTPDEFCTHYEAKRIPVIMTDVVPHWPMYKILDRRFANLKRRKMELTRSGRCDDPLRCEFTEMNIDDYVRYAEEQRDERPIYMFDAEFGNVFDTERLFSVPAHFARDDFFKVLGDDRPKYRWIIAGPSRGGSSFHVDPNYTHAWNANLTGRKRWLFFPPSCPPPGVVPSGDMSEVATPVSLMEWVLNFYQSSVEQLQHVGYECVCEPGDIIFVPCGWWHSVINLEDSVAVTQNYVSRTNLLEVLKFLRAMKSSISGINEDALNANQEETERRREGLASQFSARMTAAFPEWMQEVMQRYEEEKKEKEKQHFKRVPLLDNEEEGFKFSF